MCPNEKHKEMDLTGLLLKSHLTSEEKIKSKQTMTKTLFQGSVGLLRPQNSELNFEFRVDTLNPVKYTQNTNQTEFSSNSCQDVKITIGNIQICCSVAENITITTNGGGSSVPAKFKLALTDVKKCDQGTMTETIQNGSLTASKSCQTPWVLCSVRKHRPLLKNKPVVENISTTSLENTPTPVTLEETKSKPNPVPSEHVYCHEFENISLENQSEKMDCAVPCWNVGRPGSAKGYWERVPTENQTEPFHSEESMDCELMDLNVMDTRSGVTSSLLRPFNFTIPSTVSDQGSNNGESQSGLPPTNPMNVNTPNSSVSSNSSQDKPTTTTTCPISTQSRKGPNYVSCMEYIESENSENTSTVDTTSLGFISVTQRCKLPKHNSGVLKRLTENIEPEPLQKRTKKLIEDDISRLIASVIKSPEPNTTTEIESSSNLLEMLNVEKYKPRKICLYCNKNYSYYYFPKHMKKSHENQMQSKEFLKCPVCKEMIEGDRVALNLHLTNTHENGLKYYCYNCGKRFKDIQQVREHMADIHKENFFKCSICQKKSFPCKRSLSRHLRTTHKKIKCVLCAKDIFVKDEHEKNQKCSPHCRRPQPYKNRTRRPRRKSEP